ncbi:MAG: hypothetical protein LM582_03885 [Desulfurococcaceae archaeon]|nr:hypothetical protein [Desulfurococcaceae archaeon]
MLYLIERMSEILPANLDQHIVFKILATSKRLGVDPGTLVNRIFKDWVEATNG